MRKLGKISLAMAFMMIGLVFAGSPAFALGPSATMTPIVYGTAPVNAHTSIAASVTEANSPSIDMSQWDGLEIDLKLNSGSGTCAVQILGSMTGDAGTFYPINRQAYAAGGAWEAIPNLSATASNSFALYYVPVRYIKLVPTLTGTCNWTVTYTKRNM